MNNDILTEILLHLPVQSLLRFRTVCKFWGDVIDSQRFRKLHTHKNNSNKSDDTVCLQVSSQNKLSIKLRNNGKSLMLYESYRFNGISFSRVGEVKGLICLNPSIDYKVPIAICNPFLGQLKILPPSSNSSCNIVGRSVAIGFDEDYKVVQLLSCIEHRRLHAQLYSRRTDSWRELALDLEFYYARPIESGCKNGYFAHWHLQGRYAMGGSDKILSLDMKTEVFQTITLQADYTFRSSAFAEDEHSFRRFDFSLRGSDNLVSIYESKREGSKLSWDHVMNVEIPFSEVPLWRTGCVNIGHARRPYLYDYRARKLVCWLLPPPTAEYGYFGGFFECRGSFVSLEN